MSLCFGSGFPEEAADRQADAWPETLRTTAGLPATSRILGTFIIPNVHTQEREVSQQDALRSVMLIQICLFLLLKMICWIP